LVGRGGQSTLGPTPPSGNFAPIRRHPSQLIVADDRGCNFGEPFDFGTGEADLQDEASFQGLLRRPHGSWR
jgi:hypothetical protein